MRYGIFILALGALWSSQVSAGELQSVYVAPGGVYIASGHVHVGPENGYPTYGAPGARYYAPGYVPPGQVYRAPAFYEGYRSVYPAPSAYINSYTYAEEFRRGRLPLYHTTALRVVYSTQLMAGRDTVTNTCYDKGRFREPSFGVQPQLLSAVQSRNSMI